MNYSQKKVTRSYGLLESFLAKKRAEIANRLIKANLRKGRVLDVGCGTFPYFLSSTVFKEKYGIDSCINLRLIGNKSIFLKKLDIEKNVFPYPNNFFDTVVMLAVFEHIHSDRIKFVLKEINRVLKKDGVFIITTPAPWSDKLLWFLAYIGLVSKIEIKDHKHALDPQKIKKILTHTSFSRIESGFFELGLNMWFKVKK